MIGVEREIGIETGIEIEKGVDLMIAKNAREAEIETKIGEIGIEVEVVVKVETDIGIIIGRVDANFVYDV